MLHVLDHSHSSRHRLLTVAAVCACAILLAGLSGQSSSAQTRLDTVRDRQAHIRDELAHENAAVDAALGRVGVLRTREREVTAELEQKEAELAAARKQLAELRAALARTKRHLAGARGDLGNLLVFIYKNGEIDETEVLLNAHGFDDLATRAAYLGRINDMETGIVDRFDRLLAARVEQVGSTKEAVGRIEAARDAIDARRQTLAASRAAEEQRAAELRALQAERRDLLAHLIGKEKNLVEALSAPQPDGGGGSQGEAPSTPVAPPSGARARLNSDGTATAPADAPEAVKAVIAAANQITSTPYIYGGGHGSFESTGYDCSGSVSFALHGGGFLSSPLDSTGLMTWGEAGPGTWITVYANPGHAYMEVAGLRFDTSGAPPRWQTDLRDPVGFVVRHPAGY
jgi:peptidoglycan hydrolase CwlO-like protein